MSILVLFYLLVPVAFIVMIKNNKSTNRMWFALIIASLFIGIAPFVAAAYLFTAFKSSNESNGTTSKIAYNADGSYTLYKVEDTNGAPSPGKTAFRIIGGLVAGLTIAFGLLFVGVILLFTLAPSVACGGSSKCY
jgi:hypothetical protein